MADQASVRGAGFPGPGRRVPPGGPPRGASSGSGTNGNGTGVVGSLAEFGNDVATLAELQARLAALDLKESTERAVVPVVLVAGAAALALAALPVALLGVADLLELLLGVRAGTARLITAAVAAGVAGVILFASLGSLRRSLEPLRRSREELTRNLSWVRTVLVHSGRTYSRRRV